MPEGYLHLTCEQRCQIYALLRSGHTQSHIAHQIGVDPSTIGRELARNSGARGYRFKQADEKASLRRHQASGTPRKMTPAVVAVIEEKLTQQQWSPEQISGRLAQEGVATISHESIYRHVWNDKKDGGNLYLHLRHSGKKYNKRKGRNSGRGLIPNRVDIDQRPAIVATKSRIGDWEADTIIGPRHQGDILFACNRRYLAHLSALDDITAGIKALDRLTRPRCRDGKTIKGINFFNPLENALLRALQNPKVNIAGIRRANLAALFGQITPDRLSRRQLRRLRDIGVIKRVTGTYRSYLTRLGRAAIAAACHLTQTTIIPALA